MLTLVRHQESYANLLGLYQGQRLDSALTLFGQEEALKLKNKLSDSYNYIYCSPSLRTKQTANIINNDSYIVYSDLLKERDWGLWEGHSITYIKNNYNYLYSNRYEKGIKAPEGETLEEVEERVQNFINNIFSFILEENIIIVTHKTPAIIIKQYLSKEKFNNFSFNEVFYFRG